MTERVAGPDNFACERHHKIYEKWAKSGSGILLTGNVQIDRSCMEGPANVCIEEHSYQNQMPALKKWAEVSETDGSKLWMQISHAGRQTPGELNQEPLAPSSTALKIPGRNFGTPKAMTEDEILDVINRFAFVHVVLGFCLPIFSTLLVLMFDIDRKVHLENVNDLGYVEKE